MILKAPQAQPSSIDHSFGKVFPNVQTCIGTQECLCLFISKDPVECRQRPVAVVAYQGDEAKVEWVLALFRYTHIVIPLDFVAVQSDIFPFRDNIARSFSSFSPSVSVIALPNS